MVSWWVKSHLAKTTFCRSATLLAEGGEGVLREWRLVVSVMVFLSPQEGPAASVQMRETRPAVSAGCLWLPRAAGPQKLPDVGFCRTAVAYGFGKRHKHSSIFFILQELLTPQLLPSSSKALEPATLVYRCCSAGHTIPQIWPC